MPAGDDFFNLAQLEQPKMMPEPPIGAGALAGLMYGQDKARQDSAFNNATTLANMRMGMEAQKNKETMAGAPGRMADIEYGNTMSQGNLGTIPDALSTQSNTAASKNKASEIAKLSPYASDYDPTWASDRKKAFIDNMEKDGIKSVGKRSIDEMKDNLDQFDNLMSGTKNALVNTPPYQQKIGEIKATGDAWNQRVTTQGEYKLKGIEAQQDGALERANISSETKLAIANIQKEARLGNRKPIDAIAAKIADGTATDLERKTISWLMQNNPMVLAAGVKADSAGLNPNLDAQGNITGTFNQPQPPVIGTPPPAPARAGPGVPTPTPPPPPQPPMPSPSAGQPPMQPPAPPMQPPQPSPQPPGPQTPSAPPQAGSGLDRFAMPTQSGIYNDADIQSKKGMIMTPKGPMMVVAAKPGPGGSTIYRLTDGSTIVAK